MFIEVEGVGRKAGNRKRVLLSATLLTPDGAVKVRIKDISPTGAHVCAEVKIPAESDALLNKGSLFAAARVAWTRDLHAGLTFYRKLSEEELAAALPRPDHSCP